MADIYQDIWWADQETNGLEPLVQGEDGDAARGWVTVNPAAAGDAAPDMKVLTSVEMPAQKRATYDLCRALFNNYALPEAAREHDTPEERAERHAFVEAVLDTPPMEVARRYIEAQIGTALTRDRWYTTVFELWFRRFSQGGDPELSGFEHVVVGEQERSKVQGYHFWYKYWLDDGLAHTIPDASQLFPGLAKDQIRYLGSRMGAGQIQFPESVTISFAWDAPDYDARAVRPLSKPIGGFFVGCSVEGLMALGTVRAHVGAGAPSSAVIEGARYDMKLFHDGSRRHIRTFYPIFKGAVATPQPQPGPLPEPIPGPPSPPMGAVRILAALVNPEGHDPGRESVTVINTGPGPETLDGLRLVDRNGRETALPDRRLVPGEAVTVVLDGNGAQLGNKGGTLRLVSAQGTLQQVAWSKAEVRAQNVAILFG